MIHMSEPETRSLETDPPGGNVSDARLVEDVRHGDHGAFEILVRRYEGRLMSVLLRFVQDRELARDLSQETFLRVYERLDQFDPSRHGQRCAEKMGLREGAAGDSAGERSRTGPPGEAGVFRLHTHGQPGTRADTLC